ncbi:hypothetical protein ACFXTH_000907 [Malus domestica]
MGNRVGNKAVHSIEDEERLESHKTSSSSLRIKVRMTTTQLEELIAEVDMTRGPKSNSELGRVILRECLEGRLSARTVAAVENHDARVWKLSTICKGGEEEHEHLL